MIGSARQEVHDRKGRMREGIVRARMNKRIEGILVSGTEKAECAKV